MDVSSWSKTAINNATADVNINWQEGQPANSVNDSARAMMAAEAAWRDDQSGTVKTSGVLNAFTVTLNSAVTQYRIGLSFYVKFNRTNSGASTLSLNGLSFLPLRKTNGAEFIAGDLEENAVARVLYNQVDSRFEVASISTVFGFRNELRPAKTFYGNAFDTAQPGQNCSMVEIVNYIKETIPGAFRGAGELVILTGVRSAPAGLVAGQGQLLNRNDCARLWAVAQASDNLQIDENWAAAGRGTYSLGTNNTNFRVPDLQGIFIRSLYAGRLVGSYQSDALQDHSHNVDFNQNAIASGSAETVRPTGQGAGDYPTSGVRGANIANETRPKNIAYLHCITL